MAPKLIAKYLHPFFGQTDLEKIKTGIVNDWIMDLQSKSLEPKTIHNLWKLFRAIMNWHSQQSDELPRKWYPSLPTIPDVEQRYEDLPSFFSCANGRSAHLVDIARRTEQDGCVIEHARPN